MSNDHLAQAPEEPEVTEVQTQEAPEQEQKQTDPDIEAKAREMGWVPQDKWRGDPDQWRGAEEFVERGQRILPVVKAQYEQRIAGLERQLTDAEGKFEERVKRLERTTQVAMERQRKQIEDRYEAEKLKAVELGDTEGYRAAAQAQRDEMKALADKAEDANEAPLQNQPQLPPSTKKALEEWVAENNWIKTDRVLAATADAHFEEVRSEMPGASFQDWLSETRNRVAKAYPEKFGIRRSNGPAVESGTRISSGSGAGGQRLAAKLPPEAKEAAEMFVKDGTFKNVEEYAKAYFEQG